MPRRRPTIEDYANRPGVERGRQADALRAFGLECRAADRRAIDRVRIANGARPLWNDPNPGPKPKRAT
jgi:hypothetical protein